MDAREILLRLSRGVCPTLLIGSVDGLFVLAVGKATQRAGAGTDQRTESGIAGDRADRGTTGGSTERTGHRSLLGVGEPCTAG